MESTATITVAKVMLMLCAAAQGDGKPQGKSTGGESVYRQVAYCMQNLAYAAQERDCAVARIGIKHQLDQDNQNIFTSEDVRGLYIYALCKRIDIPFEVVGHKKLFARLLNDAYRQNFEDKKNALTLDEVNKLKLCDLTGTALDKFENIIPLASDTIRQTILNKGLAEQVEWRKKYYKHTIDLSLWQGKEAIVPGHVTQNIPDYVDNVDLENPFEHGDLKRNYSCEGFWQ